MLPDFDKNCPCPEKCAEVCYSIVHVYSYIYIIIQLSVGPEVSQCCTIKETDVHDDQEDATSD